MHDPLPVLNRSAAISAGALFALALVHTPLPGLAQTGSGGSENQQETEEEPTARRPKRLRDSLAVDPDTEWVPGQAAGDRSGELARKLSLGWRALEAGDLLGPPNNNALEYFREALVVDPGNGEAEDGLDAVADAVLADALVLLNAGETQAVMDAAAAVRGFRPGYAGLVRMEEALARRARVQSDLLRAETLLEAGQLVAPPGNNAAEVYLSMLALDEDSDDARAGLESVLLQVQQQVAELGAARDYSGALNLLGYARSLLPQEPRLAALDSQLVEARDQHWQQQQQMLIAAVERGDLGQAEQLLSRLLDSDYRGDTEGLLRRIDQLRELLSYRPGAVLQDATPVGPGPTLLIVPAGQFSMGSPPSEEGRFEREGPIRRVTFERPFALARSEISVAEFGRFVTATGYRSGAENGASSARFNLSTGALEASGGLDWRLDFLGRPASADLPVVHVTHIDAAAYARWLTEVTGQTYRLPSEAQFEYALRGRTTTRYWWGNDSPDDAVENLTGARDELDSFNWPDAFRGYSDGFWGPAPVASFRNNPFGFHDLGGNVLEWTADCFADSLDPLPADGSPLQAAGCDRRTLRGGAWATPPKHSRSASRNALSADAASCLVGFRVVRLL